MLGAGCEAARRSDLTSEARGAELMEVRGAWAAGGDWDHPQADGKLVEREGLVRWPRFSGQQDKWIALLWKAKISPGTWSRNDPQIST